ncbi:hypothetical protein ACFPOI_33540 [Nonomuraea angiospora]|uniref:Uncharacterized protein n=1 Tax=Nonomuraea angiospora TaxID=46172 RepID=A0ABR9LSX2_9ACTN|nr:hypothetical protein [Nonomuraea angiospora]MBE1583763.1 hypothetical protein [Nonomuraea angiospora]
MVSLRVSVTTKTTECLAIRLICFSSPVAAETTRSSRVSLLRERLAQRPEEEHEAIVAFRKLTFRGQIAKARMEIQWAKEGLALLDELESRGVPLRGKP